MIDSIVIHSVIKRFLYFVVSRYLKQLYNNGAANNVMFR